MPIIKYSIHESGYVGAFGTATDNHIFVSSTINKAGLKAIGSALGIECTPDRKTLSYLVGIFSRANSYGIVLSNLATENEIKAIKEAAPDINVGIIKSSLNAIGNNILANDKVAIINPEYSAQDAKEIRDILGVEVVKYDGGSFKTVGAGNILTNKGLLINNRCDDAEQAEMERITGMESIRTTANMGSLSIGLSVIANSNGAVIGSETTGFEIARITEALKIDD
ncbi:translation initiation factor IF-6 [Candidatus Marsarchaeota archaeon]|nr:translation initiation factor IF-6 [Candidatus Marsarchaeota archaeon]